MKRKTKLHAFLLGCSPLLAIPALQAGTTVDPSKIATGSATGTLAVIDVPYTTVSPTFGGPDWTTTPPTGVSANTADNGFTAPTSPANDGIREPDASNNVWEPDGTPISEAKGFFTYGNGPEPGVTWNFNLSDSGIDLPDGAVVWAVYACWSTRGSDGMRYRYTEGSNTDSIDIGQNVLPVADLELNWDDDVATTRTARFQRIFAGPIVVAGGDGFQLLGTDLIGNAGHIDAVVIDYSVPGAYWDTDGTTAGSGGATPSGTWDAATTNWDATADGTGAAATWTPGEIAVFSAGSDATGSYTVTVDGTQGIGGLFFEDGEATLAAGTSPELQLSANGLVAVLDGNTATIGAPFTETGGSWQLTKLGAGSLVLTGDNSGATGGTVLEAGVTQFDAPNSIPGTGENLTVNADAILSFGSSFGDTNIPAALDRIVTTSAGMIAADNYASTNFDLDTPGLTGAYFGAIGSVNYTGTLTPNGSAYRLGGGGGTLTFNSALTSTYSLAVKAPGTIQFNGFDADMGNFSPSGAPVLQNGSATTDMTLTLNQSSNTTFSGSFNDGGAASLKLVKSGSGDLAPRGSSDFTGGLEIAGGRITVTNDGNEQSFLGDASNVVTFTANGELFNENNAVTLPQGITINGGVTGRVTGSFGERTEVDGVLAGSGTLVVQGYSAGYNAEFRNTGNTFTGPIEIRSGDSVVAEFRSLPDSPGVTTIGLQSNANLGGSFYYMSGAIAPQVFNNRQFELIVDGNSGTNSGRQAKIVNNASGTNTITINQDLLITGTGNKKLYLGGGNTGDNTFGGDIPDGVAGAAFTLYKENGGKWILGGANTYTGGTVMSGGTLTVDGSLADSSMTVSSGTVEGSGTLTFGPTDQIDISGGTVDLSGFTVEGSVLTDPVYIIVDSVDGGSYTGTFAVENVPGYTVDYDYDGSGTQVALVSGAPVDPYVSWSGGELFGDDANGDGVSNGLAFLLGAADPDVSALDKLPTVTETSGGLVMTFTMLDTASRGTATLSIEHSSDLGITDPWSTPVAVPDATPAPQVPPIDFQVSGGPGTLSVIATISSSEAAGGKLFGRLKATE